MRRLYVQIYLTAVAILLLFALLSGVGWLFMHEEEDHRLLEGAGVILGDLLPGADADPEKLRAALSRYAGYLRADVTVWSGDQHVASTGDRLPAPESGFAGGLMRSRGTGLTVAIRLPDGRHLVARHQTAAVHTGVWLGSVAALAVAIALGAYPVVRRLTRRLERLQASVEAVGRGNLERRVEVEGNDEVAEVAKSFNRTAERIERLVESQRHTLAAASHELRSPLARIRVAVELLGSESRPELQREVARDIAELDELIEELLLFSRLETTTDLSHPEPVDLLALAAEEAARIDAEVTGESLAVRGDRRMLRTLVRNLLENARRHGGGTVEVSVHAHGPSTALLRVADRGPGVPADESERIFEPFYRLGPQNEDAGGEARAAGTGLGLTLVRRLARHHGGDAHCLPREGGGSCFEVALPLEQG